MSDPAALSRLDKVRIAREYMAYQLAQLDSTIQRLEVEEREEARRRERARLERAWTLQPPRAANGTAMLHRGGCTLYRPTAGLLRRDEALLALELEDPKVECCEICRPETGLSSGR